MEEATRTFPSAEQPDPKSEVLESIVLRAASSMSAVSSMTIVELPAPTPNAGLPELYAALTMALPPVARTMSQEAIRYCETGMLGCSMHWNRSRSEERRVGKEGSGGGG